MSQDKTQSPLAGSPAWWASRPERDDSPVGRGRPTLRFDRIIATALEIVDELGAEALSMRMLADRLESGTATLYRHVASKDEILAYVVDRVLGENEIQIPPSVNLMNLSWKDVCAIAAETLYATLKRHPHIVPVLLAQIPVGPNGLKARERALSTFRAMGLSPEISARAYTTIAHYVIGFASQLRDDSGKNAEAGAELRLYYESLDRKDFPATIQAAEYLGAISLDDEFRFGLKLIIEGLGVALISRSET